MGAEAGVLFSGGETNNYIMMHITILLATVLKRVIILTGTHKECRSARKHLCEKLEQCVLFS